MFHDPDKKRLAEQRAMVNIIGQTILKHVAFSCDEQSNKHLFCYVSPIFPVLGGSKVEHKTFDGIIAN